ncbi:Zinc finger protein 236, partial [Stegodyphus mimosarum]
MELDVINSVSNNSISTEASVPQDTVPVVRMENVSILTSESGNSVTSDLSAAQFINVPFLQEGSIPGSDTQPSYILATSADGNTILLDACQLTMLSEQTIPLYDGTNLFHVASETSQASDVNINKESGLPSEVEYSNSVPVQNEEVAREPLPSQINDEILPPDRKGPHKCSFCGQEFALAKQLHRHWKVHAEDKPNRCTECDASFNERFNLILHQATHSTSDPTCPECNKKFARMAGLKSHLLMHQIEENLICTECGNEFSTQFKLDKHMQEHLAELAM